VREEDDEEALR
jgi:hypothetical protein